MALSLEAIAERLVDFDEATRNKFSPLRDDPMFSPVILKAQERYAELKRTMSFGEADRLASIEAYSEILHQLMSMGPSL